MHAKKRIYALVGLLLIYVFFELSCFLSLKILQKYKRISFSPIDTHQLSPETKDTLTEFIDNPQYYAFDPDLGWDIKEKGYKSRFVYANSQGLRAKWEYSFEKPANTLRILTFGDSFTECEGVSNNSMWQSFLENYGNVQALNFGVGGYGVDQAYLKYLKKGKQYEADIVLIGFLPEDVNRHVLVYWPFYGAALQFTPGIAIPKPRFKLVDGQLALVEQPLRNLAEVREFMDKPSASLKALGEHDYFYQHHYKKKIFDVLPSVRLMKVVLHDILNVGEDIMEEDAFNPQSEAYQVTVKIIDRFVDDVRKNGDVPIFIIFPDEEDIRRARMGAKKRRYDPILNHVRKKGYHTIDMLAPIQDKLGDFPVEKIIVGHYSPATNKLIAQTIMLFVRGIIKEAVSPATDR